MLVSASIEVVLYVRVFPLPIEWNLNCKRDHFTSVVGTEELGHLEMIGAIVYQLTRNLSEDEIKKAGFEDYFDPERIQFIGLTELEYFKSITKKTKAAQPAVFRIKIKKNCSADLVFAPTPAFTRIFRRTYI